MSEWSNKDKRVKCGCEKKYWEEWDSRTAIL